MIDPAGMTIDPVKTFQQRLALSMSLDKYGTLLKTVRETDVSTDEDFQKAFDGFYMVRRDEKWRKKYFQLFEQAKRSEKYSFPYILEELFSLRNHVEASFASKMLATLCPDMPIWDKYVIQNLQLELPSVTDPDRLKKTEETYERLVAWYDTYLRTENAAECIKRFDEILPDYKWMSAVKKIDFCRWRAKLSAPPPGTGYGGYNNFFLWSIRLNEFGISP